MIRIAALTFLAVVALAPLPGLAADSAQQEANKKAVVEFYDKAINSGTTLERVKVGGHDGYWISGDPHFFFYTTADGRFVEDPRRWVGDALIWNDGSATYRIESSLGRDATIALAESIE